MSPDELPELPSAQEIARLQAEAEKGDEGARAALEGLRELEKDLRKAKNRAESSWGTEGHGPGGKDKGIINRLDRAIAHVQTATDNRMSPELADHYRQAVVKRKRRKRDRLAKQSRKRNRRRA